ncbi:hypothetical protein [Nocardia sp. NPDC051570]
MDAKRQSLSALARFHRLPLAEARKGYELFDRREACKVVLMADE